MSEIVTHPNSPSTEPPVLELIPAAAAADAIGLTSDHSAHSVDSANDTLVDDTVINSPVDHDTAAPAAESAEGADSEPSGESAGETADEPAAEAAESAAEVAGVKPAAQEAAAKRKALQQLRYGHATDGASSLAYPVPEGREAMPVAPKAEREKICCYIPYTGPQSTRARRYFRKFTFQEARTPSGELVTLHLKPTTFFEVLAISFALEQLKSGQRDLLNECLMRYLLAPAGLTGADHQMTRTLLNCLGPINLLNWVRDFELPVYQALGQEITDAWADPKESNLTCCVAEVPARPNAALVKTYTQALGERAAHWPEALRPLIADLVKVLRECMPSKLHDYLCLLQSLLQLNSRDFYAALHQLGQSLPKFFAFAALVKPQAWEASGHDMSKFLTATKIQPKSKQATKKAASKKPTTKKRTAKATHAADASAEASSDATLAVTETIPVDLKSSEDMPPADVVAPEDLTVIEDEASDRTDNDFSDSALSAAEPDAKAEGAAPSSGCQVSLLTRAVTNVLDTHHEDMVLGATYTDSADNPDSTDSTDSADSAPRGGLEIIIEYDPKDEEEAALMESLCADEASMGASLMALKALAEKAAQLKAKERSADAEALDVGAQLPAGAEPGAVTGEGAAQTEAAAAAIRQSVPGSAHAQKLRQRHKLQRQQRKQARRHRK